MPNIQILSPLTGSTVATTVLVNGDYSTLLLSRAVQSPSNRPRPSNARQLSNPDPIDTGKFKVIIRVKNSSDTQIATDTIIVAAASGTFEMVAAFSNHASLAGLTDCSIEASLFEGDDEVATDIVSSIIFST
jgi:hypothetical protein